ncbi:(2Fe-2S) ferredoxin domain-containing protein [Pleomorphovibrio marinus]|uniref:(2Fe-2S) ferredoxin domain-containing protein n=1 Tax=Pleomorphovibrio marinus TaxID=2164132 RepID=UPI000E0B5214|nr:(2Fe-2S) ferredoxin domain-containing protein [Pleomorphovibrio marinus]
MATYRKFIFVCTGKDCKRNGCKELLKDIKGMLKVSEHKGKCKVVKTKCMDFCKTGPMVVINSEVIKRASLPEIREKC